MFGTFPESSAVPPLLVFSSLLYFDNTLPGKVLYAGRELYVYTVF